MKKQVNVKIDEEIYNKIEVIIAKNPQYASRAHFIELAILDFFKKVKGGS